MADQRPDPDFVDGDFDTAQPTGIPVFSSPIRATTAEYSFTQEFMMSRKRFVATTLGTQHPSAGMTPNYSNYVLCAEGPRQDVGGGMIKWQRTYARVPDAYDEFESRSYPFIGYVGACSVGNQGASVTATGRPRITHTVNCRVHSDFFL